MGPQEEMFLSSFNLFSTVKEGTAYTPTTISAYTAFFCCRATEPNISNNKCQKRINLFTGLQTTGGPPLSRELSLKNGTALVYCSFTQTSHHFRVHLSAGGTVHK